MSLSGSVMIFLSSPPDYVVQNLRFEIEEGFGCTNGLDGSILSVLLINSWDVVPPLLSVIFYYRELISLCKHSFPPLIPVP